MLKNNRHLLGYIDMLGNVPDETTRNDHVRLASNENLALVTPHVAASSSRLPRISLHVPSISATTGDKLPIGIRLVLQQVSLLLSMTLSSYRKINSIKYLLVVGIPHRTRNIQGNASPAAGHQHVSGQSFELDPETKSWPHPIQFGHAFLWETGPEWLNFCWVFLLFES